MNRIRARGEDIRRYILDNVEQHPMNISAVTSKRFGISRQAVHKHLQKLTGEHALVESGTTRNRHYKLSPLVEWAKTYPISSGLAEDVIWTNDIKGALGELPGNVMDIWHYGFTEMFNNVVDHSAGSELYVRLKKTAVTTEMALFDDGVGIFKKIQTALNLLDERHAILELSKGKLTTDPKRHTGEGIFFTSRMFDSFDILSGGIYFTHKFGAAEDWIMERDQFKNGTAVWMEISNHTSRTMKKVFDEYTSNDDFSFNKTVVPVSLAQYGDDKLISRSQAKRILARVELFKIVLFDFQNVESIGRAFADEIFRVFAQAHPEIELTPINTNSAIERMIARAKTGLQTE
jgi:biotin operon repressor/anti-sigma regulatory factor (Ser/Thr protein kinase)